MLLPFLLGRTGDRLGLPRVAALGYRTAHRLTAHRAHSGSRSVFKYKALVEFYATRLEWRLNGSARPSPDPLFLCTIHPIGKSPRSDHGTTLHPTTPSSSIKPAGRFDADFTHLGLRLEGFVGRRTTAARHLELWLDEERIRTLPLHRRRLLPPFFYYHLSREVLASLPYSARLSVRTAEGQTLGFEQTTAAEITIPHGDGSLFEHLRAGGSIDKKGFLAPTPTMADRRQTRCLATYAQARHYFMQRLNTPLLLMYGTLLGQVREGDFIPGDDDFDVGYLSQQRSAAAVKQETMQIVVELVLAGFTCSFNRNGRLFRLRCQEDPPDVQLDVHPIWYAEGALWTPPQTSLPLTPDDCLPTQTVRLRGEPVEIPRHPEKILTGCYGEGWRVPDPSYSAASHTVSRRIRRKIDATCITPADYKRMQALIDSQREAHPQTGRLIAVGLHPLYPLSTYEAHCEW
ncbi:LicD family protein [Halorhodospira abdelmalekii]|uniref:LicD family protein n=1 Tax=Halorhodospira abdelmalekii TaxID=421629 RepID=UPI001F5B9F3D